MRYKVTIGQDFVASNMADAVSFSHGYWEHTFDEICGPGVVFITAYNGEDNDLCAEMDAHGGVIEYEAVGQTEQLDDMVEALTCRGEFFHGGRVGQVATEWLDAGFNATAAKLWMDAGVWQAWVAKTLVTMGKNPSSLRGLNVDVVYAWCNGDLAIVWPAYVEAAQ